MTTPELATPEPKWHNDDTQAAREANQAVLDEVSRLIKAGERRRIRVILETWPDPDLVELFVELPLKRARKLFEWRESERMRVMAALHPTLRSALLQDASVNRIAEVLNGLEPEQAVRALEDLPDVVGERVLPLLSVRPGTLRH